MSWCHNLTTKIGKVNKPIKDMRGNTMVSGRKTVTFIIKINSSLKY